MFVTFCWVTAGFIKIGSLNTYFLGEPHHHVVLAYFSIYVLVFYNWRCSNGMTETCGGRANKWTCGVQTLCLCGFKLLLKHVLHLMRNRIYNYTFRNLTNLCAIRCEESAGILVSAALHIVFTSKDRKLMSSTQCQSPDFLVRCPIDIGYTKLQDNDATPCVWFRPFQTNNYTKCHLTLFNLYSCRWNFSLSLHTYSWCTVLLLYVGLQLISLT